MLAYMCVPGLVVLLLRTVQAGETVTLFRFVAMASPICHQSEHESHPTTVSSLYPLQHGAVFPTCLPPGPRAPRRTFHSVAPGDDGTDVK